MSRRPSPTTLEDLEGQRRGDPPADATPLVVRCHRLRRMPVDDLTPDDVLCLLGQEIGVEHLLPIAREMVAHPERYEDEDDVLEALAERISP